MLELEVAGEAVGALGQVVDPDAAVAVVDCLDGAPAARDSSKRLIVSST